MNELERLIAEQAADDTSFQRPEPQSVSLDVIGAYVGASDTYFSGEDDEHYSFGNEANEVHSFLAPQKGDVLVEGATWHGTRYGYTTKLCRCGKCTEANKVYFRERRQRARTNSA